ncbi:MAG TPA: CheR family methyltransferase, partial [Chthoniobacterales bacterium]
MPDCKLPMLQSRLHRRLRQLEIDSIEKYEEYLFAPENTQREIVHFIDAVTTNKTDFFREPEHFRFLASTALDEHRRHGRSHRFTLWCAGCSSGEEPYTLAMVLAQYAASHAGFDFAILATDISTRMLDHARTGIYDESRIDPIPIALRQAYLLRSGDRSRKQVRIVPELRRRIGFHRLNFMDREYCVDNTFDAIFFRNVMIYFDKPTQEAVINKLCQHLYPGGYLFVGHSESLAGLDIPAEPVGTAIYRRIAGHSSGQQR